MIGSLFSCVNEEKQRFNEKKQRLIDIMHHSYSFELLNIDAYFYTNFKVDLKDKKISYFNSELINGAKIDPLGIIMYPTQDTCIVVYVSHIISPYTGKNTNQSMSGFFKLVLAKQDTIGWELAYTLNKNANTTDTVYCAEFCMQSGVKTYTVFKQVSSFLEKNLKTENIAKSLLEDNPNPDCIYCDKAQIERLLKRKYWFDEEQNEN